jgi:hypothetical protein
MSATRNGKLARLPAALRELLNQRLQDGEPGNHLVDWLNALPEVQAVLAAKFGGTPITGPNLSRWKRGGYRDWLADKEARSVAGQMVAEANAAAGEGAAPLTETLAQWVAARYAVATRRLAAADDEEAWRLLREMCGDVVQLRRRDYAAQRLELDRQRQERPLQSSSQPTAIGPGLEALMECSRQNPQAQAALEQLVALARRPVAGEGEALPTAE